MVTANTDDTTEAVGPRGADDSKVFATLGNWKRKLVDVSKRNRALSFKPNKVTTITIVDEQPAEVFRHLYLLGQQMIFGPKSGDEKPAAADESGPDEEIRDSAPSLEFVPYASEELGENYLDNILQTTAPPDALDKSLRRIAEQARASIEEQGVNTLFLALGMLHYKESSASDEIIKAPIVLLPVALHRTNARSGYKIKSADEDPIVNPALVEYLRRSFGIAFPDLPDLTDVPETYDLQQLFVAVREAVSNQKGWQVTTDIYLSFFSFQKFIMYKDLEANAEAFGNHPLVRQIILRSGNSVRSLPDEIREAELDREFAPEATSQVTNADSSQLRAILAVSRNHSLVLEGPPGTGKSQTITNLIAQALAENKSVLFVAEKMAALEVVHGRLVEAGLGEFCLELHSTKANKRSVMRELAAALDASLQRPPAEESAAGRIGAVREELSSYVRAIHSPHGALKMSPYQAYGELEKILAAPRLKITKPVEHFTRENFTDTERDLKDLSEAAREIGNPSEHPWRDTTRTFYSEQDLDDARVMLETLSARLTGLLNLASKTQIDFSLPEINTFADVAAAGAVADVLSRSPGAPLAVLQSEAWNSPPRQAVEIVERGRSLKKLREDLGGHFTREVFDQDHAADIAFVESKENSFFRWLNFLNNRHRAVKARWLSYRTPSYQPTLLEQAGEMRKVDQVRREQTLVASQDVQAAQLFGGLWRGEHSDWDALDNYIRWVTEFRGICVSKNLKERALAVAARPHPDVSVVNDLRREADLIREDLNSLRALTGWPANNSSPIKELGERIEALRQSVHLAPRWAAFELTRAKVAKGLAAEILESAIKGEVAFDDLPSAFRRAFFQRWLSDVVQQKRPLLNFNTRTHEQRVAEFKELDKQVLLNNRVGLVRRLRERVQARLRTNETAEAMTFLRRQLTLQRGLSPLRTTFQRSHAAIRAIKPIFMMSPLTVAQLLDGRQLPFDLVIFDEASQLPTEDSVGAVARGKQLVVVGDPKQLPPTNFFSVMNGTVTAPLGEDGTPLFEDSESILEEFMGSGAPSTRLKWHYRSAHESLINFSNVSFYDADLHTFPSVETDAHDAGLSFEHVADGVYEGKGLNLIEARRVADAVVRHAREMPDLSLGVGTFNLRQQIAIQDELEMRRRQDPGLEPFFSRSKREPFFVKNLENIQGDERDVIFLSVTYAKDANGVLRYHFGPLNGENGWRRLNVLTTRARRSMRVFSSMKGDEINPVQATSQGPQLLRDFLTYAEHGRLGSTIAGVKAQTESPFEREVFTELTKRGVRMQPQVGVAGYRIDLGVLGDAVQGRYVCGIECDGAAYHSSETARDRDRLRQQILEDRGWTIHRLWSTDWFKDRGGQIERLLGLIDGTKRRIQEERKAEEEARERLLSIEAEEERRRKEEVIRDGAGPAAQATAEQHRRLEAKPYVFAETPVHYAGQDMSEAPASLLIHAIEQVVEVEAPLHVSDLAARVAARWGCNRVGPRMMRRISGVVETLTHQKQLSLRGDFVFSVETENTVPRSRRDTKIPPERIPREEYREAVLIILRETGALDRKALTTAVRAFFGFNRTGPMLEAAISSAIDELLSEQIAGEGSVGIRLVT